MKYQPVPPHEIMEGDCYYITHLGVSDKCYSLVAGAISAAVLLLLSQRGLVHRTKEEAVSFSDELLALGIEEIQMMCRGEYVVEENPECPVCHGTGEGLFETQVCTACLGRGY